ncbi:MAG: O-acetyl-ADP-ribose deacetylase [Candidatus Bathyarchaeota archaeon]|nr:MAG: O-acetyl-ADP-ribose deacetylase [Candidatus Bathyarchaeota archaeon]
MQKSKIRIVKGDITEQTTDAIVNAANRSLLGGGGVDGAIHRKGGPKILEECRQMHTGQWSGGLPTGKAVITTGGDLPSKYVIHTVGPVWQGGKQNEARLLAEAYANSLRVAAAKGLRTIAFPSISTGAYGYPLEKAATVALKAVGEALKEQSSIAEVVFVLFSEKALKIYVNKSREFFTSD